jgi:Protein of unknown function (DUF1186)
MNYYLHKSTDRHFSRSRVPIGESIDSKVSRKAVKISQKLGIMELTEIIAELENYTGTFPRLALESAIAEQAAITPILLATVAEWKSKLEELSERPNYFLHVYAIYLLAQFKESQAYLPIVEFFSVPGEISMDVTGDLVTEDLGRILASVCDGNIEPIQQLIENRQANEYVRSSAIQSLIILVVRGTIDREVVIKYFEELFSTRLEQEYSSIWTNLVMESAVLAPLQLKQQIDRTFDADLVDEFFFSPEDVDYYINLGQEASLKELRDRKHYTSIEDTISEMEWWNCFEDRKLKESSKNHFGIGNLSSSLHKIATPTKKKAQLKMQKQARRKNRSKKK